MNLISLNNNLEAIWMEAVLISQKLVISCIYRPPKEKDFVLKFGRIAESFCHRSNVLRLQTNTIFTQESPTDQIH